MTSLLLLIATGCNQDFNVQEFKADLDVLPPVTDLGTVPVGSSTDFSLQVLNTEGGEAQISAVDVVNLAGESFVAGPDLPAVPEGGTATLALNFSPAEVGYHYAEVTVRSDAVEEAIKVFVRGQAAEALASLYPPMLDLGPVAAGESATREVTLENEGLVAFSLVAVDFGIPAFSLDDALPIELLAGESRALPIRFAARDDEPVASAATFSFGSPGLAPLTIALAANDCEHGDASLYDQDGDGWAACGTDCDDRDSAVHPGGTEICDGVDQDCDGTVDEGTECSDDDGDGQTELGGDCNDGDPGVYLGAPEDWSNGIDDDCDGAVDSSFVDADGDGYAPEGGDCDDATAAVHPGAPETADGVDNDCDGLTDEGTADYDDDGDGYSENAGDCDDADPTTYPRAVELADWCDNDCDGQVDEGTVNADDDGDGYTETGGDCDDTDPAISPAMVEIPGDGRDNDCDGTVR